MKDLDFDELDRAVSSLNTSRPDSNSVVPTPITEPVVAQSMVSVPPANLTTPSLAGRRSTGRFMDVVHPSSDMRSNLTMPERNTSQVPATSPNITAPTPVYPTPPETPKPVHDEDDDINQIGNDIANALNPTSNEPSDSPFLSGAKVDKRPLGAFSDELPAPVVAPAPTGTTLEKTANEGMESQTNNTDTPLPAELQNALLIIESDSTTHPEELVNTSVPTGANQPVGATSINQQYKEQPSSGDQNTGAIYNTDSYHKVLVRPAKKKSGWSWVLWISILLIVGVGSGVAVYLFVLPLL